MDLTAFDLDETYLNEIFINLGNSGNISFNSFFLEDEELKCLKPAE